MPSVDFHYQSEVWIHLVLQCVLSTLKIRIEDSKCMYIYETNFFY